MPIRIPRSGLAGAQQLPLGEVPNAGQGAAAEARSISQIGQAFDDAMGRVANTFATKDELDARRREKALAEKKRDEAEAEQERLRIARSEEGVDANTALGELRGEITDLRGQVLQGDMTPEEFEEEVNNVRDELENRLGAGALRKFRASAGLEFDRIMAESRQKFQQEARRIAGLKHDEAVAGLFEDVNADNYEEFKKELDELFDAIEFLKPEEVASLRRKNQGALEELAKERAQQDLGEDLLNLYRDVDHENVLGKIEEATELLGDYMILMDDEQDRVRAHTDVINQIVARAANTARTTEEMLLLRDTLGDLLDPQIKEHRQFMGIADKARRDGLIAESVELEQNPDTTIEDIDEMITKFADAESMGVVTDTERARVTAGLEQMSKEIDNKKKLEATAQDMLNNPALSVPMSPQVLKAYDEAIRNDPKRKAAFDSGNVNEIVKYLEQDVRQGVLPPSYEAHFMSWAYADPESNPALVLRAAEVYQQLVRRFGGKLDTLSSSGAGNAISGLDRDTKAWLGHVAAVRGELASTTTDPKAIIEMAQQRFDAAKKSGASGDRTLGNQSSGSQKTLIDAFVMSFTGIDDPEEARLAANPAMIDNWTVSYNRALKDGFGTTPNMAATEATAEMNRVWRKPGAGDVGPEGLITKNPPNEVEVSALRVEMDGWGKMGYFGADGSLVEISKEEFLSGIEFGQVGGLDQRVWALLYHPPSPVEEGKRLAGVQVHFENQLETGPALFPSSIPVPPWTPDLEQSPIVQRQKAVAMGAIAETFNDSFDSKLKAAFPLDLSTSLQGGRAGDPRVVFLAGPINMNRIKEANRLISLEVDAFVREAAKHYGIEGEDDLDSIIEMVESSEKQSMVAVPTSEITRSVNALTGGITMDPRIPAGAFKTVVESEPAKSDIEEALDRIKKFRALQKKATKPEDVILKIQKKKPRVRFEPRPGGGSSLIRFDRD